MQPRPLEIIGLCGPAKVGKTTVSHVLKDAHGFNRFGFAEPLRAALGGLYRSIWLQHDEVVRRLSGDLKEEPDPLLSGQSPRYALQTLGTEWGRDIMGSDFWVNLWRARVEKFQEIGQPGSSVIRIVVDDVRFPNETKVIRAMGGVVVGLVRPTEVLSSGVPEHSSEKGVQPDMLVSNTGRAPEEAAADVIASATAFKSSLL